MAEINGKGYRKGPIQGIRRGNRMTPDETKAFRERLSDMLKQGARPREIHARFADLPPDTIDKHIMAVREGWKLRVAENMEELRAKMSAQLEDLVDGHVNLAVRALGPANRDAEEARKATDTAVRAMARQSKLIGADAPERIDQSIAGAVPVVIED